MLVLVTSRSSLVVVVVMGTVVVSGSGAVIVRVSLSVVVLRVGRVSFDGNKGGSSNSDSLEHLVRFVVGGLRC